MVKESDVSSHVRIVWWPHLALTFLVLIVYANSINNAFVSDDIGGIVETAGTWNWGNVLYNDYFIHASKVFLFTIYKLFGLVSAPYRILNILFHLGSVILLYEIVKTIFAGSDPAKPAKQSSTLTSPAFIAAAFFAVHPLAIEAVGWISGGIYSQYTFFFLLALFLYINWPWQIFSPDAKSGLVFCQMKIFASWLSFLISLLISEKAVPLAAMFFLYEWLFGNLKANWKRTLPYLILACAFALFYISKLGERVSGVAAYSYSQTGGLYNPLIQIPMAISSYLQLFVWPFGLTLYHSEMAIRPVEYIVRAIVTVIFIVLYIASGVRAIQFGKSKPQFFWLSLFFLSLIPTMTPFKISWVVAERYVYTGLLGLCAAAGIGWNKVTENGEWRMEKGKIRLRDLIYIIIFLCILMALSVRTIVRNRDWKSEDTLWIATAKTSPSSPNTWNNMGDVYGRNRDLENSAKSFQKAIDINPNYADAMHNLGNALHQLGRDDEALVQYEKASEINPRLWQSYQNASSLYFEKKDYVKAGERMRQAIAITPNNPQLLTNLGVIYFFSGKITLAKQQYRFVLSQFPDYQPALIGLQQAESYKGLEIK